MKFKLPQVYFSKIMRAIVEFELIGDGDRILIGISGGKDSVLLAYALAMMRERMKIDFSLAAVTIDPLFDENFDTLGVAEFCESLSIPHETVKADISGLIAKNKKESPCFTCAFFRRGAVNRFAKERGMNKVAYAHHNDDAVETLMMSLLRSGQIQTFTPKTYLSRMNLTVIRPLVYLRESETRDAVRYHGFMPVKSPCPFDGKTERQRIKELIKGLSAENPLTYAHLAAAIREDAVGTLWPAEKTRDEMRAAYRELVN